MKTTSVQRPFDLSKLRVACRAAAETLKVAGEAIERGMTTLDLDEIIRKDTLARGGYPAPHNYKGFPRFSCISVNDVVCHGVPSAGTRLIQGDVVNVDVTTVIDGHFGDTNATFVVGEYTVPTSSKIVEATRMALELGIAQVYPGCALSSIGRAIDAHASLLGLTVVSDFGGHGIGTLFHDVPFVCHCANDSDVIMVPGMVFTIEPILCEGQPSFHVLEDGWTAKTDDGSLTAQFEHTALVTESGCEVLTLV